MIRLEKVSENETLLVVAGPLYGEAGTDFEKKLESLIGIESATITIDLGMALGITSSAIGKILSMHKRLAATGRKIRIAGCSEPIYRILRTIKLDSLMEITR